MASITVVSEEDVYKIAFLVHHGWRRDFAGTWRKEGKTKPIYDAWRSDSIIESSEFSLDEAFEAEDSE